MESVSREELTDSLSRLIRLGILSDASEELGRLGLIVDAASDLERADTLQQAIVELQLLLSREETCGNHLEPVAHYFCANALESLRIVAGREGQLHEWNQPELKQQIIHLRTALRLTSFADLHPIRRCEIYTNLGNTFHHTGRIIEAIRYWDEALDINADFAMALGNRGYGFYQHGRHVHDVQNKSLHFKEAYLGLTNSLQNDDTSISPGARDVFLNTLLSLDVLLPEGEVFKPLRVGDFPTDMTREEIQYRRWCLMKRLFINDLNELQIGFFCAHDTTALPTITTAIDAPQPSIIGFFNQLKQEFVTARYLCYEGGMPGDAHFSRQIRNYSQYFRLSGVRYLCGEAQRRPFRIAYSIFDKIAYLLNDYLGLGIPERKIYFKSMWFEKQKPGGDLLSSLADSKNKGLRALYWISNELYDRDEAYGSAIEPEAQELADIRNHLEHKYVKLHSGSPPQYGDSPPLIGYDRLALSYGVKEFEDKTVRVLALAREALLYCVQSVYEREYSMRRNTDTFSAPIDLGIFDDDWKRRY